MTNVMKINDYTEYYYERFILEVKYTSDYMIAECKETGFFYLTSAKADIDHVTNEFKKAIDTHLQNEKEKDEDLFIAETFIYALTKINKDMEKLKDNPNRSMVLDIKLGKLYEKAKDVFHLTSFDSFKTSYFMRFPDK